MQPTQTQDTSTSAHLYLGTLSVLFISTLILMKLCERNSPRMHDSFAARAIAGLLKFYLTLFHPSPRVLDRARQVLHEQQSQQLMLYPRSNFSRPIGFFYVPQSNNHHQPPQQQLRLTTRAPPPSRFAASIAITSFENIQHPLRTQ